MGWLVALPMLAVLIVINKWVNPRNRGRVAVAVITMLVAAGMGCGVAYTFLGKWTAGLVSAVQHISSDSNVQLGIALFIVIVFVGWAAADIAFDRTADKGAQFAAIITPTLLLLIIGGTMHKTGGGAVESTKAQLATFWAHFGGR